MPKRKTIWNSLIRLFWIMKMKKEPSIKLTNKTQSLAFKLITLWWIFQNKNRSIMLRYWASWQLLMLIRFTQKMKCKISKMMEWFKWWRWIIPLVKLTFKVTFIWETMMRLLPFSNQGRPITKDLKLNKVLGTSYLAPTNLINNVS